MQKTLMSSNQSRDSDKARHIKRTQRLFAKLTAMYGETFRRNLGSDQQAQLVMAEWTDQLYRFTDEQILRGLDNLESQYPPSLPEFKKLCLTDKFNTHWQQQQQVAADQNPVRPYGQAALPAPNIKEKIAKAHDACMRTIKPKIETSPGERPRDVMKRTHVASDERVFQGEEPYNQRQAERELHYAKSKD